MHPFECSCLSDIRNGIQPDFVMFLSLETIFDSLEVIIVPLSHLQCVNILKSFSESKLLFPSSASPPCSFLSRPSWIVLPSSPISNPPTGTDPLFKYSIKPSSWPCLICSDGNNVKQLSTYNLSVKWECNQNGFLAHFGDWQWSILTTNFSVLKLPAKWVHQTLRLWRYQGCSLPVR